MSETARIKSLDIGEDMRFQRREWKVQTVGRVVIGLVVLGGATGALGGGVLAKRTVSDGPVSISYNSPTRALRTTPVVLRVENPASGKLEISVPSEYVRDVEIQQVSPQPESSSAGGGRTTYTFDAAESTDEFQVTFHVRPAKPGTHEVGVEVGGAAEAQLGFGQLVLP